MEYGWIRPNSTLNSGRDAVEYWVGMLWSNGLGGCRVWVEQSKETEVEKNAVEYWVGMLWSNGLGCCGVWVDQTNLKKTEFGKRCC